MRLSLFLLTVVLGTAAATPLQLSCGDTCDMGDPNCGITFTNFDVNGMINWHLDLLVMLTLTRGRCLCRRPFSGPLYDLPFFCHSRVGATGLCRTDYFATINGVPSNGSFTMAVNFSYIESVNPICPEACITEFIGNGEGGCLGRALIGAPPPPHAHFFKYTSRLPFAGWMPAWVHFDRTARVVLSLAPLTPTPPPASIHVPRSSLCIARMLTARAARRHQGRTMCTSTR